jgi:uncharacterized protein with GYD domain
MALYLLQVSYTPEAWAAMVKNPQDRLVAVRPAIEKLGGKLLSGYLAFGEYDLIAITDMPNNVSAAAFSLAAAAGGAISKLVTTPLMSTKDGIEAMKKAGASTYKPPTARASAKRK